MSAASRRRAAVATRPMGEPAPLDAPTLDIEEAAPEEAPPEPPSAPLADEPPSLVRPLDPAACGAYVAASAAHREIDPAACGAAPRPPEA